MFTLKFTIVNLMFIIQSSMFNNQYSIFGLGCSQFKISMFRCSHFMSLFTVHGSFTIQCSLFKCSKSMFKPRVQSSMSMFSLQCSMMVPGYHKCMSGVHVSIDLQCLILIPVYLNVHFRGHWFTKLHLMTTRFHAQTVHFRSSDTVVDCGCLHRTGMFEVYNRVKTIIVFTDVYLVDNMYNVET